MGRGAWLLLGAFVAMAAVAAGAYAVTRDGGYRCADAVPEVDITDRNLPVYSGGDDISEAVASAAEEELGDVRGRGAPLSEDEARLIEHGVIALRKPPEGWSGPRGLLVDFGDPRLELVDDVVLDDSELLGAPRSGVQTGMAGAYVVVDATSGSLRWTRGQNGQSAGGAPVGDDWVLVQADVGEPPSVAALDPTNGSLRTCVAVGRGGGGPAGLAAWPVGDAVAVAQDATPSSAARVALVDPARGQVAWDVELDALSQVDSLVAAGDSLVLASVANDPEARAQAAVQAAAGGEGGDGTDGGALRAGVQTVGTADGARGWNYATDPAGGPAFVHTVVGGTDEVVVVAADRVTDQAVETGTVIATQVVALDLASGGPRWTSDLPNEGSSTAADARLFGDVLVTTEISAGDDGTRTVELVARDVNSGDELWRIPHRTTVLRDADIGPHQELLLPTNTRVGNGMEIVDLRSGEIEIGFDGVALSRIDVDGSTGAVTAAFGPVAPGVLVMYDLST